MKPSGLILQLKHLRKSLRDVRRLRQLLVNILRGAIRTYEILSYARLERAPKEAKGHKLSIATHRPGCSPYIKLTAENCKVCKLQPIRKIILTAKHPISLSRVCKFRPCLPIKFRIGLPSSSAVTEASALALSALSSLSQNMARNFFPRKK
jgi:hypothetical protein